MRVQEGGGEHEGRRSRIQQELESLRERIADLGVLERELTRAAQAMRAAPDEAQAAARSAEIIRAEIEDRLGYFPAYLEPFRQFPDILENLWGEIVARYLDNPLPEPFKTRVIACLSRFCASPYAAVTMSCRLFSQGAPPAEILRLLELQPPRTPEGIDQLLAEVRRLEQPPAELPAPGSEAEAALLRAIALAFSRPEHAAECNEVLRPVLGARNQAWLLNLLAYVKSFHMLVEGVPDLAYHSDPLARAHLLRLLGAEPRLTALLRDRRGELRTAGGEPAAEARYRELFENANDMVYTMDRQGRLTSVNRAAERLTGYAREELLQMKLADLVVPEQRAAVESILSRETGAPGTYELDILTKNGERLALEISAHWIARQGQGVGLQGIARDVTERRRTEEALQQAKQKLEAWVGELEQRTREMTLLSEMGDMLRACLTTDEAYSVIVRVAQQVFPVEVGALYVITPARNMVEAVALWGNPNLAERVFAPEECWALRRGRVHWVEDASAGLVCSHVKELPPDGYLCVPMMAQSEALGVLHLMQPRAARLTEAKQRLAVAMAEHIAMALSNLKLHETLRSQSIRDPLTGLFNRRFMEESLELELRRAVRNQRPLSVIMLDLDGFKRFNDSHGHDAGDALLRELGALLQGNIRAEDIACRYGGEEFTLIMPEGSAEIAAQRAELLRAAIKKLEVEHRGRTLGSVTASLGVAVFPEHGRTRDALLEAADAALYLSKGAGGDKVTLAR